MNKKKIIIIAVAALVVLAIVLTSVLLTVGKKNDGEQNNQGDTSVKIVTVYFVANGGLPVQNIRIQQGRTLGNVPTTTREGFTFDGWYLDEGCTVAFDCGQPIIEDITLYAKWTKIIPPDPPPVEEYVTISFDSVGGTIIPAQVIKKGGNATLPIAPKKRGYDFDGWWSADYSSKWNFSDAVNDDITLYAKWVEVDTYEKVGDVVYFGTYPQAKVVDANLITELNNIAKKPTRTDAGAWTSYGYNKKVDPDFMWYIDIEYDGEKYRGVYFIEYRSNDARADNSKERSYQDENGYYVETFYWFLYQPIKWRVVEEIDGKAMLLCDIAIDAQTFDYDGEYSNNYANSTIREWLNGNFYNLAFGNMQKDRILTTHVDNSTQSTGDSSNANVCKNTDDNVFLLSYTEATNYASKSVENGKFESAKQALMLGASDYAKSQGCFESKDGYCYWRLRSPYAINSNSSAYVEQSGVIKSSYKVFYSDFGIVPSLWISTADLSV